MYSTPAVAGYLLFVASCNGRMRALDKRTGQVKWEYDITKDGDLHEFHGDPLITDELVVIGTDGKMGHVYAFEQSTGLVRWKYRVDERGVASKKDLEHFEYLPKSIMPSDYGSVLSATELDDLVSYLVRAARAAKKEPAARTKSDIEEEEN